MSKKELIIQSCANETNKQELSSEIIKVENVNNTPFTVVRIGENKGFLSLGKFKLTDDIFEVNSNEHIDYIENNMWDLILKLVSITAQIKEEL